MEPGRPYREYVESEARRYWQEIGREHNLTKPNQEEVRAAAMPILCQVLRNRPGHRRHSAVAAVVQHAMEEGWIKTPYSNPYSSGSYIDALIQLADDAAWLALEIPLPNHPPPYHPAIYYTISSVSGRLAPVPREDALISGDYVFDNKWTGPGRLIRFIEIYPWRGSWSRGIDQRVLNTGHAYYTLSFGPGEGPVNFRPVLITYHWKDRANRYMQVYTREY